MLNEKNEKTKNIIHLMVTSLCKRDCEFCCNKQYDLNDIPYVTKEELKDCETLCITGGEPFAFTDPSAIAFHYKSRYPNIKNVYVYSNATELRQYMFRNNALPYIDGVSVSIKNKLDLISFEFILKVFEMFKIKLKSNRLYVFNNLMPVNTGDFEVFKREWQKEFKPSDDSIFRKA